jgi:ABC-type amino acid transport substrate-binding protein
MKYKPVFFVLVLVALLIAACGGTATPSPTAGMPTTTSAAATPAATVAPTEGVKGSGDPTWDRIQSTGKIVFGTSADYKPFEYYDTNSYMDGFDIAIARNLGARLGLQVEL